MSNMCNKSNLEIIEVLDKKEILDLIEKPFSSNTADLRPPEKPMYTNVWTMYWNHFPQTPVKTATKGNVYMYTMYTVVNKKPEKGK